MKKTRLFQLILIALTSFSFILNCAKIESPPGGPVDKTGPKIILTNPANNSTNVLKDNMVTVEFSEPVDKETVMKSVFISPRIEEELEFKWKKNILSIILPDSFLNNITYVVNLGSEIKDLRKNGMDSSTTIAFTTGAELNKGMIKGMAIFDGKPASGATIALYDIPRPDSTSKFDSLYPAYQIQTGKDGSYTLSYLPDGTYFILAFHDKNKNQLLNIPRESFGLPDRPTIVDFNTESQMNFSLREIDTGQVSIISATPNGNNSVKVRFSHEILADKLTFNFEKIYLKDIRTGNQSVPRGLKEKNDEKGKTFTLFFDNIPADSLKLLIENDLFNPNQDSIPFMESPDFAFIKMTDSIPPTISDFSHDRKKIDTADNKLVIYFNEPGKFDLSDSPMGTLIEIYDQDSIKYDYESINIEDPFKLQLVLDLDWDRKYRLVLNENLVSDFSGNKLGDSLKEYAFETFYEDSLGAISGSIIKDNSLQGSSYLILKDIKGKTILTQKNDNDTFAFSVIPGKYMLSGFLDRNDNGKYDFGNLKPFEYSETYFNHPDTIRVRARFESAGVNLYIK